MTQFLLDVIKIKITLVNSHGDCPPAEIYSVS